MNHCCVDVGPPSTTSANIYPALVLCLVCAGMPNFFLLIKNGIFCLKNKAIRHNNHYGRRFKYKTVHCLPFHISLSKFEYRRLTSDEPQCTRDTKSFNYYTQSSWIGKHNTFFKIISHNMYILIRIEISYFT